jgi:hypothetical protein
MAGTMTAVSDPGDSGCAGRRLDLLVSVIAQNAGSLTQFDSGW